MYKILRTVNDINVKENGRIHPFYYSHLFSHLDHLLKMKNKNKAIFDFWKVLSKEKKIRRKLFPYV